MKDSNNLLTYFVLLIAVLTLGFSSATYLQRQAISVTVPFEGSVPESAFQVKEVDKIIEKEKIVPADYVVVDGRNYNPQNIRDILEAKNNDGSFSEFVQGLLDDSEDEEITFGGNTYDDFEITEWNPDDCTIRLTEKDDGTLSCDNVEVKHGSESDSCNLDIEFRNDEFYQLDADC